MLYWILKLIHEHSSWTKCWTPKHAMLTYLKIAHGSFDFHGFKSLHVSVLHKLISIDTTGLMQPQTHKVQRIFDTLCSCKEKSLKDIREVSEIEDIVELDGSGQESGGHLLV